MTERARPVLEPGRVYRTRDLAAWSANPSRLARRMVTEGELLPMARGLFASPRRSRFGSVPPSDAELMRGFLDDAPFLFTGPQRWNALGLGTTAVFAVTLVYNTKRSGRFVLGNRPFVLRRVAFPDPAPPEWFVVDLFEHADQAATAREALLPALETAILNGRFSEARLQSMAKRFGTDQTRQAVSQACRGASLARRSGSERMLRRAKDESMRRLYDP